MDTRVTVDRFQAAAHTYEDWYSTVYGRRADQCERALLTWLLRALPNTADVLEVGCGTGHFTQWLAASGLRVVGLDRSPAMLAESHGRVPHIPVLYGDAHQLPLRTAAVDVAAFVTTLEFLADARTALSEAARVARRGLVVVALNRWSLGGLSRRYGPHSRRPLLGHARDYSIVGLRRLLRAATGARLREIRWASTLFPNGVWKLRARLPLGDVIGLAAVLATPTGAPSGVLESVDRNRRETRVCRLLAGRRARTFRCTVP